MLMKFKAFFQLDRPYRFDVTDITALIYVLCAVLVMCGINATIPFFIGATIATAFCWQAKRINLVVLNVALWVMNAYNLCVMIWGIGVKEFLFPIFGLFALSAMLIILSVYFHEKDKNIANEEKASLSPDDEEEISQKEEITEQQKITKSLQNLNFDNDDSAE